MAKKAVLTRNPDYYLSYDVGEEMTLVAEKGYNMEYGAIEYLFVNDADIEQSVMGGDFRWIDEDVRTSIEVGDKVRIKDVSCVLFSDRYFRDGDITEVVAEHSRGGMYVEIPQKVANSDNEMKHGVPVLYITKTERENFFEKVSETHWEDDQSRIAELEAEVAELKEQLAAAKTLLKGAL